MNGLRQEYSRFLGGHPSRILLTGHSHQAWPDVARTALTDAFDDAAEQVDDKWSGGVARQLSRLRPRILGRLGLPIERSGLSFAQSTHELVFRLLSALDPGGVVVATTGEFHSAYRQLRRLEESGVRVRWVARDPIGDLPERLLAASEGASLIMTSAVFFEDAAVLGKLPGLVTECAKRGTNLLVDAYHGFQAMPLDFGLDVDTLFVVAGGYKYAQFGEGVCFMRSPAGAKLRPVYTGWFADFAALDRIRDGAPIDYGDADSRWAGSTFDPSALYRANAVLDLFDRHGLTPAVLRERSLKQTQLLLSVLDEARLDVVTPRAKEARGGFVAVRVEDAGAVVGGLRAQGVWVDQRGGCVRLGPAPYLLDDEIVKGAKALVSLVSTGR